MPYDNLTSFEDIRRDVGIGEMEVVLYKTFTRTVIISDSDSMLSDCSDCDQFYIGSENNTAVDSPDSFMMGRRKILP